MADALDSKSSEGDLVRVQVPPSAPIGNKTNHFITNEFVLFFANEYFGIRLLLKS